jgi:hypothetical protein
MECQQRPLEVEQQAKCAGCGGITRPMPILDSRLGKKFRLHRCESCESMAWTEDNK